MFSSFKGTQHSERLRLTFEEVQTVRPVIHTAGAVLTGDSELGLYRIAVRHADSCLDNQQAAMPRLEAVQPA